MTVPRGEIFGFLGPNGAGKTTAVKLFLGLSRPTGGEAFILGAPIGDLQARRRIGYLPELFRYQDFLTAREVLELHCVLARLERRRRRDQIDAVLETVGLTTRAGDRVGTFSKGMQQRLGLAVAMVGEPELIVLDEPTSALDPVGRRDVRDVLHGLKMRGVTVFLNSHLLTEVEQVCDRVAIVDRGRVVAMGPLDEITKQGFAVRIRLDGGGEQTAVDVLQAFGRAARADGAILVEDIEPARVPDAVAALIAARLRIAAVEPNRRSLEEHFLRVLRGSDDGDARDR